MEAQSPSAFGPFPPTSWSLIGRVNCGDASARREALGVLLNRYLPALRARLVHDRKMGDDRTSDLIQGFIADKLVEQDLIARADRNRGKFRSFVLTALDHYVIDRIRSESGTNRPKIEGDGELALLAGPEAPPSRAVVREWARQVVAQAIEGMEAECAARHRPDLWALFRARVLDHAMHGMTPAPYESLTQQLGFASAADAANALVTAKRMFQRTLRAVVSEYVDEPDQIDPEITELRAALAG